MSVLAFAPCAAEAQQPAPALQEAGVWLNDLGDGAVEIYVCQDKASRLCGRIVWLKEPLNAQGQPKRDRFNPKEAMQNRPICGLPVLGNLARVSEGGFDSGWIYDPKAGKSYDAAIRLAQRDQLVVTGYLGMKFMGKSFTWTRAPADLPRCDGSSPQPINNGGAAKPTTPPGASAAAPQKATKPAAALAPTTAATGAASGGTKPASTAKAPAATTTSKTTAAKTTTAPPGSATKTTTAKAAAAPAKATAKPATATAKATTAAAAPKPKPAQKPGNAVAKLNPDGSQPPPQPAEKSSAPKTIEADSATTWSD
jgi:uncharacterized protein (DUF2147 family)